MMSVQYLDAMIPILRLFIPGVEKSKYEIFLKISKLFLFPISPQTNPSFPPPTYNSKFNQNNDKE